MALGYELTITDSRGTEIILSSMDNGKHKGGDIIGASYKSNTLDDNVTSRINNVRAEIKVIGKITPENKEDTCKLAEWSKERANDLINRTVKLVAYPNTTDYNVLRSYEIEEMFVVDYTEDFDERTCASTGAGNGNGVFELYIVQKQGANSQYIETE